MDTIETRYALALLAKTYWLERYLRDDNENRLECAYYCHYSMKVTEIRIEISKNAIPFLEQIGYYDALFKIAGNIAVDWERGKITLLEAIDQCQQLSESDYA